MGKGETMFLGQYDHHVDAKGRLIIPSKFREDLGTKAILSKGLDGCLFLFPLEEWESLADKLKSLPLGRSEARSFTRYFFSSAIELECDKQGRIMIPTHLKEYAKIEKNVTVVGVSSRVEIWNSDIWYDGELTAEDISAHAESLAELLGDNF